MAGYLIGVSDFKFEEFLLLIVGGFLVTGSANGFNQILEQDYDKLMIRTSERPLPKKKISSSSAIIFSIIIGIIGFYFLSLIKPHTSFYGFLSKSSAFGLLSLMIYVLSYTPLKRMSTASIFIGAIPGAIPVLLGWVAATDNFGLAVGILFAIQFLWQFPHFISIAWIQDDQYKKAGFKMMYGEKKGTYPAKIALVTSLVMTIVSVLPFFLALENLNISIGSFFLILALGLWFSTKSYSLLRNINDESAKKVMLASFIYLPSMQLVYVLDKWVAIWFF
jgi:protoheme IX farnesyltransferase|tara:strand:- start:16039 stop:16872 length:834 start_codon:yes stop_codon:yes gene_type:complete